MGGVHYSLSKMWSTNCNGSDLLHKMWFFFYSSRTVDTSSTDDAPQSQTKAVNSTKIG